MYFIDTHAHVDFDDISLDKEGLLKAMPLAGLKYVINPGVRPEDYHKVIDIINTYDYMYASLGVHPTESDCWNDDVYQAIQDNVMNDKVVAIGETGLDYYHNPDDKELQRKVFSHQIDLALQHALPLIIHNREAHEDTLAVLKDQKAWTVGGVFHCYNGSVEFAERCVQENFFIGIGGVVTFKNAITLQEVVKSLPLEAILLETDSPFLSPHPERGFQNNPLYIPTIALKVAELKGIDITEVANVTTKNAIKLFKLPDC